MKVFRRSGLLGLMIFFMLAGISCGVGGAKDHYNMGVRYASEGSFIQAREEFKVALKLNPRGKGYKESLKGIEDAIDLKVKKGAVMHLFKGVVYGEKGAWDKAIPELTKALEIDPKYAAAYINRGVAYQIKGQYDLAIADYTKTIEIDPKYADAYNNRGIAYNDKGQFDRAIADYIKAIEIDSKYADAYYNRGIAYYKKGQYDLAIADDTKALEIDPKYANAYNNRGAVYILNLGETTKACRDFKRACELGECGTYNIIKSRGDCR